MQGPQPWPFVHPQLRNNLDVLASCHRARTMDRVELGAATAHGVLHAPRAKGEDVTRARPHAQHVRLRVARPVLEGGERQPQRLPVRRRPRHPGRAVGAQQREDGLAPRARGNGVKVA